MVPLEKMRAMLGRGPSLAKVAEFSVGAKKLRFRERPSLMGVINLSKDSWYRESVCMSADAAIKRGIMLSAQGADIVDVGAESTLAQAERVGSLAQKSLLLPVIRHLSRLKIPVSVETYSKTVTRASLQAGARVLNLTGTEGSRELFRMVADHDAAVIICHVAGKNVRQVRDLDLSGDPIPMLYEFFGRQIELASRCGVRKIFLDPGLGFYYRNLQDSAVRVRHQMEVFLNSHRLRVLGHPICNALPHAFEYFEEEVRCAEPFFAVLAALGGTDLFRTHEVRRVQSVLKTLQAF